MKLTAVVLTKNEEGVVERCLRSLSFSSELIVIDDNSSDKTVDIARRLGAKVYQRDLDGDYASQRNFGLKKANNDWVLFVDADELVSRELRQEVTNNKLQGTNFNGFYIRRRDVFLGKEIKHGESGKIKILRFGKKDSGKFKRKVHEYWDVSGDVGELKGELIHYPHKTLKEFVSKVSKYSKVHAEENYKEGKSSSIFKIIVFPLGKFIHNYFYKLAIIDGVHGLVLSVVMSFHSFVSWSDLWLKNKKVQ